jgi:gas vesicle protein
MNEDATKIAGAFLLGGLVGATIALLYAPKSGRDTRKDITKAAKRIRKETGELVDDTIESINEFAADVKERVGDLIERGVELSEHAKKEIVKTFEQGQKTFEKQKNRIVEGLGL